MTKDEVLKLALEFIENSECGTADLEAHIKEALAQTQEPVDDDIASIIACRNMLDAQPVQQEPVAWQLWVGADTPLNAPMGWQFYSTHDSLNSAKLSARTINSYQQAPFAKLVPLYTAPQAQRTWVGINKEEAFELLKKHEGKPSSLSAAVENLLREKNT